MTESGLQAHPPILNNLRNFSGIVPTRVSRRLESRMEFCELSDDSRPGASPYSSQIIERASLLTAQTEQIGPGFGVRQKPSHLPLLKITPQLFPERKSD